MSRDATKRLADGVEVRRLDTAFPGEPLLVTANGKYYEVRALSREVVGCLAKGPQSISTICTALAEAGYERRDPVTVERILQQLGRLRLLEDGDQTATRTGWFRPNRSRRYLLLAIPLFSESLLRPLTSFLAPLFAPRVMAIVLPTAFVLQLLCWLGSLRSTFALAASLTSTQWSWLVFGNYAALLAHELGHASGCANRKIRHGPIGFCIYMVFPAFFADVSEAWTLARRDRLVVDAAGIYASLLCASVLTAAYWLTGEPTLALLAILCDITVVMSLNPFMRFDGFWMLSDALGVQNLMAVNRELTAWLIRRPFGIECTRPRAFLIQPRMLRYTYLAYYPLFLGFTVWVFYRLFFRYLPYVVHAVPAAVTELTMQAAQGRATLFTIVGSVLRLAALLLPLIAVFMYVHRIVSRVRTFVAASLTWTGRARQESVAPVARDVVRADSTPLQERVQQTRSSG